MLFQQLHGDSMFSKNLEQFKLILQSETRQEREISQSKLLFNRNI